MGIFHARCFCTAARLQFQNAVFPAHSVRRAVNDQDVVPGTLRRANGFNSTGRDGSRPFPARRTRIDLNTSPRCLFRCQ